MFFRQPMSPIYPANPTSRPYPAAPSAPSSIPHTSGNAESDCSSSHLPIQQPSPDAAPHTPHKARSHPPSSRSARHNPRPVAPATPCSQPPDYCPAAARLAVWTASARTRNRSGSGWHSTGKGRFFFASASSFCNFLIFSSNL